MKRLWLVTMVVGLALAFFGVMCLPAHAQAPEAAKAAKDAGAAVGGISLDGIRTGLYAVGVALILLGGAIGTGLAQQGIGAAVVGAVAEDKKFLGIGLILLALPETILFICAGFAYLLFGKL